MITNRNYCAILLCLATLAGGSGCFPRSGGTPVADTLSSSAEGVRMALASMADSTLPAKTWQELLSAGQLSAPQLLWNVAFPQTYLDALSATSRADLHIGPTSVFRVDRVTIGTNFQPVNITDHALAIPLQLTAQSHIEVVRPFSNKDQANRASPFSVLSLPLDAARATALLPGTAVSIPITGRVSTDVSGRFLEKAWQASRAIESVVTSSAAGLLSGTIQGRLVAEGNWTLQIVRQTGNHVRVRLTQSQKVGAGGSVGVNAGGHTRYLFTPLSALDRALNIRQRILDRSEGQLNPTIAQLEAAFNGAKLNLLPRLAQVRQSMASVPIVVNAAVDFAKRAATRPDSAAGDAERGNTATLQQQVFTQVSSAIGRASEIVRKRILPVHDTIKKYTDRTFNLNASMELSGEFNQRFNFVADYVFDLADESSRQAYEHAVSGRALWVGSQPRWNLEGSSLLDFSLAEALAGEDEANSKKRVTRMEVSQGHIQTKKLAATFAAPFVKTGFSEQWRQNNLRILDERGSTTEWFASAWDFTHRVTLGNQTDMNRLASGILVPGQSSGSPQTLGTYWFSWDSANKNSATNGMETTFHEAINLLGRLAFQLDIPALFKGEFQGKMTTKLLVAMTPEAVARLFNPAVTSDAILWQALGQVAATFDNTFGLPMNQMASIPAWVEADSTANAACNTVTKEWGRAYCAAFAEDFLPRLHAARAQTDPAVRMKVFEYFYTKGFLANKIGARLLIRYLTEVSFLTRAGQLSNDFIVRFQVVNDRNPSAFASPTLDHGNSDELGAILSLSELPGEGRS